MAITIEDLIDLLSTYSPQGIDLPRDTDTNDPHTSLITSWAQDGAGAINARRGKTTCLETDITLVADQQEYDLPSNCREVIKIIRLTTGGTHVNEVLGVPIDFRGGLYPSNFGYGCLPSGQEISPSIDLLSRQRASQLDREDDFELYAGQIRFLFPIIADEIVRVKYRAVDRSIASVPDDYKMLLLAYLRYQNLNWWLTKHGASLAIDGDRTVTLPQTALNAMRRAAMEEWNSGLNAIGSEAN